MTPPALLSAVARGAPAWTWVVVLDAPPVDLAATFARLLAADWLESDRVLLRRARSARIDAEQAMPFTGDENPLQAGTAGVRALPRALRVLVGEAYERG